jgi:hypothetical protein
MPPEKNHTRFFMLSLFSESICTVRSGCIAILCTGVWPVKTRKVWLFLRHRM